MKANNKLKGILIGAVVVALAAAAYAYQHHIKKQVNLSTAQLKKAIKKQDYEQLISLFDEDSIEEAGFTKESAATKYATIFNALNVSSVKITDFKQEKQDKNHYQVAYKLSMTTSMGEIKDEAYQTTLTKTDNGWQFEWSPALIFAEMTGNDKVMINEETAERGKILDRNGVELATKRAYQQVGVIPAKLGEGEERDKNIKAIAKKFDLDVETIESFLAPDWATGEVFVPLKTLVNDLSDEDLADLPTGVMISSKETRYYPLGEASAQLLGYTGQATAEDIEKNPELTADMTIGKAGLEASLDDQLRGKNGGTVQIEDEDGKVKRVILANDKEDGQDVTLTIDSKAQKIAFDSLDNQPGSAVASDPSTGELLVLASSPSYNPNQMTVGISTKDYQTYQEDENLPFIERYATNYAPGSTFKTLTAMIALDAGTLKPSDSLDINGLKWQQDDSWGNYYVTRVKEASPVNLETALVNSDNIFFAQKMLEMGEKTFRQGLEKFDFNESLELPITVPKASISNEASFDSNILLADTGYGQGELMIAPVTQLSMYSTLMNDGNLVYPQLVKGQEKPADKKQVVSKESANIVLNDLVGVVANQDGYAHDLYQSGRVIAAKTGTAEIKDKQDTTGKENSFLLFMDQEQKQFMGLVMSEDSRENGTAVSKTGALLDYLVTNY
ncbi:penicillin-binding transpeptidase domain-containing protein [Vagococcus zengguangii]|uniref:Penicillin-binding transpeptidase domain-containing protein n=1 Tax=Vagococcus zengguangii TaxID=2571750 RepID=A0A4D7CTS5_9ENTE|nr:penicillin-binding transpeptidase domain-containing protein [Vagococcus zengguangii]QCI86653.1 penicillin-binding transpeptidase domain-containing protein [Vagococcus zengguangii]TLG79714.1 penicillin-binding transpeptidase domain-containing protein [Vagococcus zengguangii]